MCGTDDEKRRAANARAAAQARRRYANDPSYRERAKARAKAYYEKRSAADPDYKPQRNAQVALYRQKLKAGHTPTPRTLFDEKPRLRQCEGCGRMTTTLYCPACS